MLTHSSKQQRRNLQGSSFQFSIVRASCPRVMYLYIWPARSLINHNKPVILSHLKDDYI